MLTVISPGTVIELLNLSCLFNFLASFFSVRKRREEENAPDENELQPLGVVSVAPNKEGSINEGNNDKPLL